MQMGVEAVLRVFEGVGTRGLDLSVPGPELQIILLKRVSMFLSPASNLLAYICPGPRRDSASLRAREAASPAGDRT